MPLAPNETSCSSTARSAREIRTYLITELSKSLEMEPAAIDTAAPLDRVGVDSLMALGIAGGLAEWLDRDIPATLLWDYRSIDAIAEALATGLPPRQLPAGVVALQPDGQGTPIFGFPGLAGTPLAFAAMASKLGDDQPFYGVAVPGFEGLPGSFGTVEEIAAAMLVMIRQVRPNGPYRLAGFCFGGLLAYEAARQLVAAGEQVSLLAIYDAFTRAGRVKRPLWQLLFVHLYLLASGRSSLKEVLAKLRWSHLSQKLNEVDPEFRIEQHIARSSAAERLWHINALAAANYRAENYSGPIVWFQATEREKHNIFYKLMPCGGWSQSTTGSVTTVTIPGDHGDLIGPEHAQTAADALRPFLASS
jgi:thioesterase domain-containing protein/acyl carrier protein